jgi:UDP-N-acetylmuramate dehydrogenase
LNAIPIIGNQPLLILGGGSNLLFTKDFPGLVLLNQLKGFEICEETDTHTWVKSGAGENWHSFVIQCISKNLGGIENLSLIPGNVGASPMQNIGAYGVEIKDTFHSLEAIHLKTGEIRSFTNEECCFGYRESVFKNELKGQYLILSVTFRLTRKNHQYHIEYGAISQELEKQGITERTLQAISNAVIAIRKSKLPDPAQLGNSGSFFKNPVVEMSVLEQIQKNYPDVVSYPAGLGKVKLAAGWLIEKAGWKGFRKGDAGVHVNQALVLVNYGHATGAEIWQLSAAIIEDIERKFGVNLEREVNVR